MIYKTKGQIENGNLVLPIEHHIVGLAKNGIGKIEIEGNSYQDGTPTPTSPIPIQSFNGSGDTVKLVGASGKELQLPNSITLNNQTISLELNKVGTYADKLIIDKASGKVELVRKVTDLSLGVYSGVYKSDASYGAYRAYMPSFNAYVPDVDTTFIGFSDIYAPTTTRTMYSSATNGLIAAGKQGWWGEGYIIVCDDAFADKTAEQIRTYLTPHRVIYRRRDATDTAIDITNATYQINGITYNVSDWLNFVDREIEIETDGLAQSNLSVDYEPTLIYNYAKRELPVGFVRLDYIESTGTQWIDTGYIPNQDTKVDIKVMLRPNLTSGNYCIFSGRTYLSMNSYSLFFLIIQYSVARFDYDDTQLPFNIDFSSLVNTDLEIFTDKNKCYFNGVLKTQANYSDFTSAYPMSIGASYADGVNNNFACMRIYFCKIYDNDTLVRNFIPCYRYSDGIEGLYDTVGKQFYTNQGTGRFLRGNIIDGGILNNGN